MEWHICGAMRSTRSPLRGSARLKCVTNCNGPQFKKWGERQRSAPAQALGDRTPVSIMWCRDMVFSAGGPPRERDDMTNWHQRRGRHRPFSTAQYEHIDAVPHRLITKTV